MSQPGFSLSAKSQMSASPRMQQAVRLLQMSALDFEQALLQELATNPFLEEIEVGAEAGDTTASEFDEHLIMAMEIGISGASSDDLNTSFVLSPDLVAFDHAIAGSSPDMEASHADVEISSLEAADWNELPSPGFEASTRNTGGESDNDPYHRACSEITLREHLHQQISGTRLTERERLAVVLVIETLDDDGYLRDDISETALPFNLAKPLSARETARGIEIVQQFDPAGVAARSLSECLLLQLRALDQGTPGLALALTLAESHLELLGRRDTSALQRRLDCSVKSLQTAQTLIRSLNPRPGADFNAVRTDYIVPDVIVLSQKGGLVAMINPAVMPRARLNLGCIDLLRQTANGKYPAMQQQLQEARWLIRNAEQRYTTIQRVAEAIVQRQKAFFKYGEIALRPLILREVSEELGLHESTLSRATANKYMATPRGIFEFRHFFSRQLETETGGTCSATAVRQMIREMIEGESRTAPLSDVILAKKLTDSGICVARRTVAKYRNQLKMPPWESRHAV